MAVIYLKHPTHGAKVAICHMEASNDMQLGWEPFDPTQPEPAPEPAPAAPVAIGPEPVNLLAQLPRRGRPRKE